MQVFPKKFPWFQQESLSSDAEMEVQSPECYQPYTSQKFMPYIEGTKMDWTVNDSLYLRFPKWKLKCENILDCELAMLPESKKCKKVIAWSGDFGMDQYVSWCLPTEDPSLEVIWAKYEDFASHRPIKLGSDLTYWQASDKAIGQLMSGTMLFKLKCLLPNTHQKLQVSCTEIFSSFS